MKKNEVFATKIPGELKRQISFVCESLGLKKNFVIEEAIREKLEDLLDGHDLREAVKEATGFHSWSKVKKDLK